MTIINSYQNGNCIVSLYDDGTKIREYDGFPQVEFPESIDLKITDYCELGCGYCHEKSTVDGQHATTVHIRHLLRGLPAGVEIAIGGGNPFAHPNLLRILTDIYERGLISNVTVNALHLGKYGESILDYRAMRFIKGLGISYNPLKKEDIFKFSDSNSVVHFIAGVHKVEDLVEIMKRGSSKCLILGYKQYGRGISYFNTSVDKSLKKWRYWIGPILRNTKGILAFDNLALKQLGIKDILSDTLWDSFYMGNDGGYSMYVDAVRQEFAVSSTSSRIPLDGRTIRQSFQEIVKNVS